MKNKNSRFITGLAVGILGFYLVRRHRIKQAEEMIWRNQRRFALDVLACPECCGSLIITRLPEIDMYHCPACQKNYPVVNGVPHFIQSEKLSGWNKRFAAMYDLFSWGYRAFSMIAFAYIGMNEEQARREVTDRLEPQGGRILEVSVGPGVNLPYLVRRDDVGEIYGLDISLGQLNRCREYVAHKGWDVQLQLGNAEQLPYKDNTFNGVFHVGGINFFNNKKKAIEEMIRVARPGTRILICDENERGARAYERFLPCFKQAAGNTREPIVAPIHLVPAEMLEKRVFDVWKGWLYCIEFRKP